MFVIMVVPVYVPTSSTRVFFSSTFSSTLVISLFLNSSHSNMRDGYIITVVICYNGCDLAVIGM